MKKLALFYTEYSPIIDAIKNSLVDVEVQENPNELTSFDLIALCNYNGEIAEEALNMHYSLLPAFDCENPIKEAFLYSAKVTGITIYYKNSKKIIAQYPVFISNDAHYDDIVQEIEYLAQTIYPIVIKKLLENEIFDLKSVLSNSGCSSCGGCKTCNH